MNSNIFVCSTVLLDTIMQKFGAIFWHTHNNVTSGFLVELFSEEFLYKLGLRDNSNVTLFVRAVVRTGATGAIAPVDFGKESQIAPVGHDSILILAPVV